MTFCLNLTPLNRDCSRKILVIVVSQSIREVFTNTFVCPLLGTCVNWTGWAVAYRKLAVSSFIKLFSTNFVNSTDHFGILVMKSTILYTHVTGRDY